jgi:7-cyano-7-deazaguanine synthase in queuosine biosynthesis
MPDRDIVVEDPNELVKDHKGVTVCHPFLYTEKDEIIAQYVSHNILDLLNITRSCEGDFADIDYTTYTPNQIVPECGECFWCQERNWAKEKNNV